MDSFILIHKILTGVASAPEIGELNDWIASDPSNKKQFEEIRKVWEDARNGVDAKLSREEFQTEFDKLERMIGSYRKQVGSGTVGLIVLLFLIVLSVCVWFLGFREKESRWVAVREEKIILPGKGHATLKKGSDFSLTESSDSITARLTGDALIEISSSDNKAVTIHCDAVQLRVDRASAFVVSANLIQPVTVTLLTGAVMVTSAGRSLHLFSGESTTVARGDTQLMRNTNRDVNFDSWYTRKLEFRKETLGNILKKVAAVYDVAFDLSEDLLGHQFTGTFLNASVQEVMATICDGLHLHYERVGDGRYVFRASAGSGK